MHYTRRCWAEVDLDAVLSNFAVLKKRLGKTLPIAVVKADGYSHGALPIAQILQKEEGVKAFAVSNLDEAEQLRSGGILGLILILGYTPPEEAKRLHSFKITQTILSQEYADKLNEYAKNTNVVLPVHIALDTGMNRVGFSAYDVNPQKLRWSNLSIEGAFTHFCHADSYDSSAREFTKRQADLFEKASKGIPCRHLQNTAGVLTEMGTGYDFARLGIALYGLTPSTELKESGLKPAMSFKSVVSMVKTIPAGSFVGYGRTWRAERETKVATVSAGYADGYPHKLSNNAEVLVRGKKLKVIGTVCMDQLMLDATGTDVAMGDEATLFGKDGENIITVDDLAKKAETIGYEIICMISKRAPRVYIKDGREIYAQVWV